MNWIKQQVANVAGTQEPIYGPSAIQSVAKQAEQIPYTELHKEDLKWAAMTSTCAETQTFYLMADSGHIGMAQVIYSNVAGIHTTCQWNTKIFYPNGKSPNLWSSDPLKNFNFDHEKLSCWADDCAITLSEDGTSYTVKSATNDASIVNLTITRTSPGFHVGKDGKSYFGTDPKHPWGSMRHGFWPRCQAEGSIITNAGEVNFKGRAFFVHALQGMKPHHAGKEVIALFNDFDFTDDLIAAKWNFVNFQSPNYSAVMMEYTTPPSYGSTIVNVGGIATDGEILCAGSRGNSVEHTKVTSDRDNEWPEPEAVKYVWGGVTKDKKAVSATLAGSLGRRLDKVDVLAKIPGFIKTIVGGVVGTKPYIYQYAPQQKLSITVKLDGVETTEEGDLFTEATFIS